MRVISGKYRGKKLLAPEGMNTRPTTDRVKEALFGAIQFIVPKAKVLDLFAGSGALGIEALSRGAESCVFVENDLKSIDVLKTNLENIEGEYRIMNSDYLSALNNLKNEKYDLVFLDPPYESGYYKKSMEFLRDNDIVEEEGIIVLEVKTGIETKAEEYFSLKKKKTYGKINLEFYER